VLKLVVNVVGLRDAYDTVRSVLRHAAGRVSGEEATYIPDPERHMIYREARAWLLVYAAVAALAVALHSLLPLMYVGLPTLLHEPDYYVRRNLPATAQPFRADMHRAVFEA
jgi:hypothetical protein